MVNLIIFICKFCVSFFQSPRNGDELSDGENGSVEDEGDSGSTEGGLIMNNVDTNSPSAGGINKGVRLKVCDFFSFIILCVYGWTPFDLCRWQTSTFAEETPNWEGPINTRREMGTTRDSLYLELGTAIDTKPQWHEVHQAAWIE